MRFKNATMAELIITEHDVPGIVNEKLIEMHNRLATLTRTSAAAERAINVEFVSRDVPTKASRKSTRRKGARSKA